MPIANRKEDIIELQNISFSYGDDKVLNNLSLEVHKGDYLGVIGPNGGGKTTLIKIMLGLLPAQGEIRLFGKDIRQFKEWSKIGYVSQRATQIDTSFPITVTEVVSMGRYSLKGIFHFLNAEDKKRVVEALREVEMDGYRNRLIGDLSTGQQQRVFVARALVGEPEVLVLDEPTVGIDSKTQEQFYALLRKLNHEKHITLILVSHDLDVIEREATQLLCINRSLVYCGPVKEFRVHENYSDFYKESMKIHHH